MQINSPIPGKILKWHVKNGDFIKPGDTILQLAEIKEDYWDPNLVLRAQQSLQAKKEVTQNYQLKINMTQRQLEAIESSQKLKLTQNKIKAEQLQQKLKADQADLVAINNELSLLQDQYNRHKKLFDEGLVSLTKLQETSVKFQNAVAKKTSSENKIAQTNQEILNNEVERNAIVQDFNEKISKTQGEVFQNLGYIGSTNSDIAKLENQVTNYQVRQGLYHIIASQHGQVIQINKSGINEVLKEGENIGMIVPIDVTYAVEFFVKPMDLPLINEGQIVNLVFDGFPAIVFSGWPEASFGIFKSRVFAIESNVEENGMYRIILVEEQNQKKWPRLIRIGLGVKGFALLNDVPIFYEIWRQINGFPPDFFKGYKTDEKLKKTDKK
jgi:multidrug efflux pump subunit AcrA (membrane-fusion protein)